MTDLVELRGDIDADTIAIIDAVVQATPGSNRMTIVRDVLKTWAKQKVHEATLVTRLSRDKVIGREA